MEPFPTEEPQEPPKTLVAFCKFYTRGAWPVIIAMAILTAAIALVEVMLFGFLGNVVDWLSSHTRETFLAAEGNKLIAIALVSVFVLPLLALFQSLFVHQSLLGNYPMRIRWQVHRYLLKQSMTFYQDEFAGRVATKLMQTALAVRETVMKVLDVLNYVSFYFLGVLVLLASLDWLFMVPMLVWLGAYIMMLRYFIPRLRKIGQTQADARSTMTGRIVDSYTNIATVKLFSHSHREEEFAKEGMEEFLATVHGQMRLVTLFHFMLYAINALLLFAVSAIGINLWLAGAVTVGSVAVPISLVLRMHGMSQWIMWEVSALFENIGTVEDGITSISMPRLVQDAPGAKPLVVAKGGIGFENIDFHYGKGGGVIDGLHLIIKPGEKIGLVGRSGRGQVNTGQSAAALLRSRKRAHHHRRTGHSQGHPGQFARTYRYGDAGYIAASSLGSRQHSLWSPKCRGRGHARRPLAARKPTASLPNSMIRKVARVLMRMSANAA